MKTSIDLLLCTSTGPCALQLNGGTTSLRGVQSAGRSCHTLIVRGFAHSPASRIVTIAAVLMGARERPARHMRKRRKADASGSPSKACSFVGQQRNDVRIPPVGGTDFSIVDLIGSAPTRSMRVELTTAMTERQEPFVYAPLRIGGSGTPGASISFAGTLFPPAPTDAEYRSRRIAAPGATAFIRVIPGRGVSALPASCAMRAHRTLADWTVGREHRRRLRAARSHQC